MEEKFSSEISADFQRNIWWYILKNITLHNRRCESFKSYRMKEDYEQSRQLIFWGECKYGVDIVTTVAGVYSPSLCNLNALTQHHKQNFDIVWNEYKIPFFHKI
jgi:hypothetical protein